MSPILLKIAYPALGGALGFLYYKFIGCRTGVCPLTSTPIGSVFLGAMIAFFIFVS